MTEVYLLPPPPSDSSVGGLAAFGRFDSVDQLNIHQKLYDFSGDDEDANSMEFANAERKKRSPTIILKPTTVSQIQKSKAPPSVFVVADNTNVNGKHEKHAKPVRSSALKSSMLEDSVSNGSVHSEYEEESGNEESAESIDESGRLRGHSQSFIAQSVTELESMTEEEGGGRDGGDVGDGSHSDRDDRDDRGDSDDEREDKSYEQSYEQSYEKDEDMDNRDSRDDRDNRDDRDEDQSENQSEDSYRGQERESDKDEDSADNGPYVPQKAMSFSGEANKHYILSLFPLFYN